MVKSKLQSVTICEGRVTPNIHIFGWPTLMGETFAVQPICKICAFHWEKLSRVANIRDLAGINFCGCANFENFAKISFRG